MTQRDKDLRFLNLTRATYAIVVVLLIALVVMATNGCSTLTPHRVESKGASFDGNERNSGFLGFNPDGSGHITAHARDRYNELIRAYGREFSPALKADDGLTPLADGTYRIDAQHLVAFGTMAETNRAGIAPR